MSVHANFGTVVESCSKKVAASSVWASADSPDWRGGDSANSAAVFFPISLLRSAGKIWQTSPEIPVISFRVFLPAFDKNGRKKTGNLFLISRLVLLFVAAVICFSFPGSELVAHA